MKLVLASDNKGKLREFGALFADHGIEVVSQGALGVTPCEEPFCTFLENALAKARNAAKTTGLPAMADDSGITAHALVTEPGVHSARYSGKKSDDAANNAKLVERYPSLKTRARTTPVCSWRCARTTIPIRSFAKAAGTVKLSRLPRGTAVSGTIPIFTCPSRGARQQSCLLRRRTV